MRGTLIAAAMLWAGAVGAQDRAGEFDYFVLALSWSPTWCEGDGRSDSEQCDPRRDFAFLVHGLWPQHERGWPRDCRTDQPGPTRAEAAAMADIMGSGGLAFAQWRRHGRCTGLDGADYLRLTREAFERIALPPALSAAARAAQSSPAAVEQAFLDANPGLPAEGVTVLCEGDRLREVRLCLTRDLAPRACGGDVASDCRARSVRLPAAP